MDANVGGPVVPFALRMPLPGLLKPDCVKLLDDPKSSVVADTAVTMIQRGLANTVWRDLADLFLLLTRALSGSEVTESMRTVAYHRGVTLRPLVDVFVGVSGESQEVAWRLRQGAVDRVPENVAVVSDVIETSTRACVLEAIPSTAARQRLPTPRPGTGSRAR